MISRGYGAGRVGDEWGYDGEGRDRMDQMREWGDGWVLGESKGQTAAPDYVMLRSAFFSSSSPSVSFSITGKLRA